MSAEWQTSRLGDAADLLTGFPFRSAEYVNDQMQPRLLRGDNIIQGKLRWEDSQHWPSSKAASVQEYALADGDVVVAMDRPWIEAGLKFARITKHDLPCFLVQRVSRLRARQHVDQRFLSFLIASRGFTEHVLAVQTGTSVPHISPGQIKEFEFVLPPMDEQQAIARVLGALDDKIELNRRINRMLEELAAAFFRSWFADFDPVVAKAAGRKPAHLRPDLAALFPAHFQDSELGPIPYGWRVAALSEIAAVNARKLPRDYQHAEIEYLDISSVTEGIITGTTRVPRDSAPSRAQRLVAHGDTIWSCVRPNRRSFALIQDPPENMVVSTGFATLTPTCGSAAFIYTATTTEDFTDYLTAHAEGSAYPAVRPDTFETAPLVVPTPEVLIQFEKIVAPWLAQVAHNVRESQTLAALRDTLLPKLLSGELRVKSAEKRVEASA